MVFKRVSERINDYAHMYREMIASGQVFRNLQFSDVPTVSLDSHTIRYALFID